MPRSPNFDYEHVLDEAMYVFWRKGYHATSMRDLIQATSLQPGSLYAAFGGKRQLFERVLDHYHSYNVGHIRANLSADVPPLARLRLVFDRLIKRCHGERTGRGCLMSNTILELSEVDPDLSQRANRMFEDIEAELVSVIEEGQDRGEIPRSREATSLARYLVMGIHGIRIYSRGKPTTAHLESLVDEILGSIASLPVAR